MSVNGIGALERGERLSPQRETLDLLAAALELDGEERRAFHAAALYGRTLRSGDRTANVTAGPWPEARTTNLPLPLTSFVGRKVELAEIAELVGTHRLVTLTGAGGIGKTRTALEAAAALRHAFAEGVWLAEFAPLVDESLVATVIAAAVGVQPPSNRPLLETLHTYFRHRRVLLLMDNCEHVIDEAARIAESLLSVCPGLHILATSRESLRVPGEQAFRLPSLDTPPLEPNGRLGAQQAVSYAAVALFADRARSVNHRFAVDDETAPAIAQICRRLDGIPLAIELAAARVTILPLTTLLKKLDERFALLTDGARTALPRQQTMRAAIDWSYGLLSESEQVIFERLAVFVGGCTLETAAAVCVGENPDESLVLQALSSLVDKSLVIADLQTPEPTYRLLESYREYGRERLAARCELDVVSERHARAYLSVAQRMGGFERPPDETWLPAARVHVENWRGALEWSLSARGSIEVGQRLAGQLINVWRILSQPEARRWVRLALSLVDGQTPPNVIAALELSSVATALVMNENRDAHAAATRALDLYVRLGDRFGIARAQGLLAHSLIRLGRAAEAKPFSEASMQTTRELDCRPARGVTTGQFGARPIDDGRTGCSPGKV